MWCSGVGLSGTDEQLVPADHSLPHVHLVKPDVGFTYQGFLHELPSIRHQEKLGMHEKDKENLSVSYLYVLCQLKKCMLFSMIINSCKQIVTSISISLKFNAFYRPGNFRAHMSYLQPKKQLLTTL